MLHVLFAAHTLDIRAGGAERVLYDLLCAMDRERFRVALAVPRDEAMSSLDLSQALDLHPLPPADWGTTRKRSGATRVAISLLRLGLSFLALLRRERPDVIYVNSVFALHFAVWPARLCGIPVVYHEHNMVSQRMGSLWHRAFPWLLRGVDRIVAITDAVRNELVEFGVDPAIVETIHNGIGPAPGEPARPSLTPLPRSLESPGFVVGQVANLHEWKGHETVVRSIPAVRAAVPEARFLMIGGIADPDHYTRLLQLAKQLGVLDALEFAGFRDDVPQLVPRLSCLLVASKAEPFGLVLLEAMQARVPVVGSAAGGVPEIIENGVNGLLFPPGDHAALAETLIRIARSPELATALIDGGTRTLGNRFSIPAQARAVEEVLERLTASSSACARSRQYDPQESRSPDNRR